MASLEALRLESDLKGQRLRSAYALVGDDDALVSGSIRVLKARVETADQPGGMTTDLDEERVEPSRVFDELRTQPFMGMKGLRLVIVRRGDDFLERSGEAVQDYLSRPAAAGVLVLCCQKLDMRRAVSKAIDQAGLIVDCSKLQWRDARNWLDAEARKSGKVLTPQALSCLIDAVGPNVAALKGELEKLAVYAGQEKTITERDVEEVVPESRQRSIFDLGDAIARRDVAQAVRMGEHLLLRGERLEALLAFLGARTRTLWQVRRMLDSGASAGDISRALGLPDFAVRRSIEAVQGLPDRRFARQLKLLTDADAALKTTSIRSSEESTWLSSLLANLCR